MDDWVLSHGDYTVGWICALPVETAAAKLMLDKIHPPSSLNCLPMDQNTYTLGSIGEHNIVIASLPSGAYGTTSAATVGTQLFSSFRNVRFVFMVGIGGGIPSTGSNRDIRLGDVVVSQPMETCGGVIQYDLGKRLNNGQFKRTGMLNRPPKALLTAVATLQAHHLTEDSRISEFLSQVQATMAPHKAIQFSRPNQDDCLFQVEYDHVRQNTTCVDCDKTKLFSRPLRGHQEPVIHYGLIGSANQVVKDGRLRDQLGRDLDIICLEMEAAGLMNDFPCMVIRGICDYADSHKNKEWQGYAAAVAAAYTKELLLQVQIKSTSIARDTVAESARRFDIPLDLTAVPVIENFLGRQSDLEELWQYLKPGESQSRKVAILHGLGGMGKTQLSIRFARDHRHHFTSIFWLSGQNRSTLLQSLSSVWHRLGLPEQPRTHDPVDDGEVELRAKDVLKWLAIEENSNWLIIFDNIDQYSIIPSQSAYDIAEFFPGADHGSILITSRLKGLTELGRSFHLQSLNTKDSIELLLQSSRLSAKGMNTNLENSPDAAALASRLDGLPLAIVIAGAFMRETGTSIAEYLHYYQECWSELQQQSSPERHYQHGNILQTWMISYYEIQKREPSAASLLLLLSHFDNRDIWYELVQNGFDALNTPTGSATSNEVHSGGQDQAVSFNCFQNRRVPPVWLERTAANRLAFRISVKTLIEFSLLELKQQEGCYTMHPVVQDWCLHVSRTDKASPELKDIALICVGYTVPLPGDRQYWELQQRLLPQANHVSHVCGSWSDGNATVWGAFHGLGSLYSDQGKLKEAEKMYQHALSGRETALGPEHKSTLDTLHSLGRLYRRQNRLKEAEKFYQRALRGRENALGPNHKSTLDTVHDLGGLYRRQDKFKEAEDMYRRALAEREKLFGPNHTSTLDTVHSFGVLYRERGRQNEAEEMFQRALIGRETALGTENPSTLDTLRNLGQLYFLQDKQAEAEEMYQRALEGYQNLNALDADHTYILGTIYGLGSLYLRQGRLREAEEMFQQAVAGYEKAVGPEHPYTLAAIFSLGHLRRDQDKLKEAKEMYQRALTGYEKILGPNHTMTLQVLKELDGVKSSGCR